MATFAVQCWDWDPSTVAGCCALIALYEWMGGLRLSAKAAAWAGAVLIVLLALVSPMNVLAEKYLFSVHMAEHILFVLIVPALLLTGLPARPVEHALRYRPLAVADRICRYPAVAWAAGIGAMVLWHIPAVFNAACMHQSMRSVECVSLLICGCIFWWPILTPLQHTRMQPVPQGIAYLFTACLACTSIGILITFSPALLYAPYAHPRDVYGILPAIRNEWGMTAAMDQQIGGLLMWVPCCFVYLTGIMAMFVRWYGEDAELTSAEVQKEVQWT